MARNIRLNNAGNLKAPDEATGRKYWGKYGYTGLDEDGFAMFDTAAGGRAALEQQIRIDQSRDQTQEEFINKYVGASADPQGTTNAQINIPQLTGAPSDTTLSEIDKDVLFNAIVQNEGGKDSVDYFAKPKLDYDALDKTQGRAAAQDTAKEFDSFLPTAPAPTIESETIGGAKPTATGLTGDQLTQRILDQDAALAKEEASGPPLPAADAGGSMTTPVGPVVAPAAPAMPDTGTAPALQGNGAAINKQFGKLLRPQNKFTPQNVEQLDVPDDVDAMDVDIRGMAAEDEALDFDSTAGRYPEHPILMKETAVTPQPEAVEGKPSFLSRVGGFAKNNPELLAQIAQAGGGLMQNIAQGRAQKKADAKTRGAMAQSNLIGALTGGKSRPAVMREEAEQGGLLARLGQAVEAGGRVAGGEMQRRTTEEDKERALGQKDEEIRIKDAAQQADKAYKEAIAGIKELSAGLGGAATQKQIKQMQGTLNVIGKFKKDIMGIKGIGGMIEGQATRLPLLGKMLNEDAQRYQDQRAMLVGTVAKIINGGGSQVSNFEQQQAEKVVPDLTSPRDVGEFGQAKFTQLEDIINLRIAALRGGGTGSIDMQVAEMMGDPDKPTKIDPADQGTMEQALNGDAEAERLIRAKYPNLMD